MRPGKVVSPTLVVEAHGADIHRLGKVARWLS